MFAPFRVWGFPCVVGWVGRVLPAVQSCWLLAALSILNSGRYRLSWPSEPAYGALKFLGTILVAWQHKGSWFTWQLVDWFGVC